MGGPHAAHGLNPTNLSQVMKLNWCYVPGKKEGWGYPVGWRSHRIEVGSGPDLLDCLSPHILSEKIKYYCTNLFYYDANNCT